MERLNMTDREQRIAIGKTQGAKLWNNPTIYKPTQIWSIDCPSPGDVIYHLSDECGLLPDYLNNLNAMSIVEQLVRQDQFHYVNYAKNLFKVVSGVDWTGNLGYFAFEFVTATARQRAEAFLKTLELWKENS